MNRRTLLRTAALAPIAALGLAGCQTADDLGTAISDAQMIVNGLAALDVSPPLPAGLLPAIEADVALAQKAYAALQSAVSAAAAAPSVKTIETAVNNVIDTLAALPLPPPYSGYLAAVAALLPAIEAGVGLLVPAGVAARASMTPAQARAVLAPLPPAKPR